MLYLTCYTLQLTDDVLHITSNVPQLTSDVLKLAHNVLQLICDMLQLTNNVLQLSGLSCRVLRMLFEHEAVRPSVQTSSEGPGKC